MSIADFTTLSDSPSPVLHLNYRESGSEVLYFSWLGYRFIPCCPATLNGYDYGTVLKDFPAMATIAEKGDLVFIAERVTRKKLSPDEYVKSVLLTDRSAVKHIFMVVSLRGAVAHCITFGDDELCSVVASVSLDLDHRLQTGTPSDSYQYEGLCEVSTNLAAILLDCSLREGYNYPLSESEYYTLTTNSSLDYIAILHTKNGEKVFTAVTNTSSLILARRALQAELSAGEYAVFLNTDTRDWQYLCVDVNFSTQAGLYTLTTNGATVHSGDYPEYHSTNDTDLSPVPYSFPIKHPQRIVDTAWALLPNFVTIVFSPTSNIPEEEFLLPRV